MDKLEKDFQFYKENQDKLLKKYAGKFIVIVNQEVVDCYDNEETAYFESEKKFGLGNFFIIKCEPGNKSYTYRFHTRAIFS